MYGHVSLSEIINVEQNIKDILNVYVGDKIPVWSLFRQTFLNVIYNRIINFEQSTNVSLSLTPHVRNYALRSYMHNMLYSSKNRNYKILFRCSDFERLYVTKENKNFHRAIGYFQLYSTNMCIDSLQLLVPFPICHWIGNRYANGFIIEPLHLKLYGRFLPAQKSIKKAKDFVYMLYEAYADYLCITLDPNVIDMLIRRLTILLTSTEYRCSYYNRLFDRFSHIKLIIAEELCYGGEQAVFCATASDRGINTAEYQHGMVTSGHIAYVHSDILCRNNIYKRTLPQYFLGFGEWWGKQIRIPSKFIPIGYPHRTEQLKNLKDDACAHIKDILVLGQTDNTVSEWLDICAELAEKLGAIYRIVFRPHPAFSSIADKIYQDNKYKKVCLEYKHDLYQALFSAKVVISESSTGLFEAIGVVNKIFVKESLNAKFSMPNNPFETFKTTSELIEKILSPDCGVITKEDSANYWAENSEQKYDNFVRKIFKNDI